MNFQELSETYQLIDNPYDPSSGFDNKLFSKVDIDLILSRIQPAMIWTLAKGETINTERGIKITETYISNGLNSENALGYFVANVPFDKYKNVTVSVTL